MKSINFVLVGDHTIATQLGKKGTASDIAIYDRKSAEAVYTWTVPITFPDKIQSLMQAVGMAEYAIVNVATLDKYLGEQIVALDYAGMSSGFVLHSYGVDRDRLRAILKPTILSGYKVVDSVDELKVEMAKLEPRRVDGPLAIPVDHSFDVKGVGTVVLGVVRTGAVKVYDELVLAPSMHPIMVKSIQMHDDPVQSASSPSRVGLAIKGAVADDISRGDIICHADSGIETGTTLNIKLTTSPHFKGEVVESQMYMLSLSMQIRPIKVKNSGSDRLEIIAEKAVAYRKGQTCVLLKPDNQGSRIIGKGQIE